MLRLPSLESFDAAQSGFAGGSQACASHLILELADVGCHSSNFRFVADIECFTIGDFTDAKLVQNCIGNNNSVGVGCGVTLSSGFGEDLNRNRLRFLRDDATGKTLSRVVAEHVDGVSAWLASKRRRFRWTFNRCNRVDGVNVHIELASLIVRLQCEEFDECRFSRSKVDSNESMLRASFGTSAAEAALRRRTRETAAREREQFSFFDLFPMAFAFIWKRFVYGMTELSAVCIISDKNLQAQSKTVSCDVFLWHPPNNRFGHY